MVSETTSRAVFIESVVVFLQKYGFDGVDIHWLYPGMRGGLSTDRIFFVLLLRELRGSLDEHGLLLSVAVGSAKTQVPIAYNIPEISSSVHYIVLLTHSYHGDWENFTGINAPLYPQETDKSEVDLYDNVNWTVNHWIAHKAEREKLIIGIATFGRNWILEDPMVCLFLP
ncbi:hypothetical protein QYM36_001227 [Artemia franciscana]|uniref:GH18 domain-containing protein n=1 Tax=Artemia franciscana TaxID=6661 RepID=A0AA88I5S7_ARTSF|nr:hypothetical protein QYM36_001227 [Artemia franciscana]